MNKNLVGYNNEIHPCQVDIRSIHFPCMRILVQLSPPLPVQLLGACTELLPFVSSASHSLMLSDTLRAVLFPGLRNPIELEKSLGGNMGRRFLVGLSKSFSLSQHVTLQSWKWAGFYRKAPSWAALLRNAPGYWKRNETHWRRQEPWTRAGRCLSHPIKHWESFTSTEDRASIQHTRVFLSFLASLIV